ncbi:LOW QUALITY PROTEIN: thyroid peroxidase-like [Macrochelys suwanniensis]
MNVGGYEERERAIHESKSERKADGEELDGRYREEQCALQPTESHPVHGHWVSHEVLPMQNENVSLDSGYAHRLVEWGQWVDHDMDLTPQSISTTCFVDGTDCFQGSTNSNQCFPIQAHCTFSCTGTVLRQMAGGLGLSEGCNNRKKNMLTGVITQVGPVPHLGSVTLVSLGHRVFTAMFPLSDDHPLCGGRMECPPLICSSPACSDGGSSFLLGQLQPREQLNSITSFVDGSTASLLSKKLCNFTRAGLLAGNLEYSDGAAPLLSCTEKKSPNSCALTRNPCPPTNTSDVSCFVVGRRCSGQHGRIAVYSNSSLKVIPVNVVLFLRC